MLTDYGQMPTEKLNAYSKKMYAEYEEKFFFTGAQGKGSAVIEHVTELTANSKGEVGAYFPLVSRLTGGGIVGDNTMDGRERSSAAHWQKVNFDQFRNALINKGRLTDQKSLIHLRKTHRPLLTGWLADANEDQAILTASGISYAFNTDGSARTNPEGQDPWTELAYASDVSAPTTNRHRRWSAASGLVAGDTTAVTAADVATYDMLPELKAFAQNKRIPPVRIGGREVHFLLVYTNVMARLWRDSNFRTSIVNADLRGSGNALVRFGHLTVHDLVVVPYARTFNTTGAASGSKWGAAADVNGSRCLLLGAQALARADLETPRWVENEKDYENRQGFGIAHMGGWLKPKFPSSYDGGETEDFGVAAIDVAI
jgi:hypothetical protein